MRRILIIDGGATNAKVSTVRRRAWLTEAGHVQRADGRTFALPLGIRERPSPAATVQSVLQVLMDYALEMWI